MFLTNMRWERDGCGERDGVEDMDGCEKADGYRERDGCEDRDGCEEKVCVYGSLSKKNRPSNMCHTPLQ
jgi:hypothetical protein